MATRTCPICGSSFEPRYSHHRYDSATCRRRAETEQRVALTQLGREAAKEHGMSYLELNPPAQTPLDAYNEAIRSGHGHDYAIKAQKLANIRADRTERRASTVEENDLGERIDAISSAGYLRKVERCEDEVQSLRNRWTGTKAEFEAAAAEIYAKHGI